jgi:hypothetical protein
MKEVRRKRLRWAAKIIAARTLQTNSNSHAYNLAWQSRPQASYDEGVNSHSSPAAASPSKAAQVYATIIGPCQAAKYGLPFLLRFQYKPSEGHIYICYQKVNLGESMTTMPGDYNPGMARGWESKSVEAQQAEVADKQAKIRPPLTAQQAMHQREQEVLRLTRNRVLQQLQGNLNPRHRKLLEEELADLDAKLRRLDAPTT